MSKKTSIPLSHLQAWMQQVLINPLGTAEKKPHDFLPEHQQNTNLEDIITPSSRLSARQRLAIYQRGYLARLRGCMASQFKALAYALGEDLFRQFSDIYLQEYPSTTYNLMYLGERFATFLEETRPDKNETAKESWIDFMIELVEFEYYINLIFNAELAVNIRPAKAAHSDEELKLTSVYQIFEHQYPILWFYRAFVQDQTPQLPFEQRNFCVITRQGEQLALHPLSEGQYYFLIYLKKEGTIEATKQRFLSEKGITEAQWQEVWGAWKNYFGKIGLLRLAL